MEAPAEGLAMLAAADLLAHATPADVAAVAESSEWLRIDSGSELFAAGDPADGMYLVMRGRLETHVEDGLVAEIGRGGTIGELALLGGTPRTASVRAARDSVLVRIPPAQLPVLAGRSPALALGLARLAARRASNAPPLPMAAPPPRSIGVVALDGSELASGMADDISARWAGTRDVRRIRTEELRVWADGGGPAHVVSRLAAAEDRSDLLVISLSADPSADAGGLASAVLRQTDLVLGVASADGRPDERILAALHQARRPLSLALVRTCARPPAGTQRWVRAVSRHTDIRARVHVRAGDASDLDRLARAVMGRSVGVVLGGGGARGFAHIGVLRALREAGVPIDLVGGSSMGAIMGAQFAMGLSPAEMLEANVAGWTRRRLLDFGFPTLSLLRGRGATKVIDGFFADAHIEDLSLDYFCTTVDLSEFRLHIAKEGQVAEWVRGSASVPGLWPPIVDEFGHLHVDGGMLNNVPTDVMRSEQAGTVIGVDVCSRQSDMKVPSTARTLPTGLSLFRARRSGQWFPSILDVLNRANLLASLRHQQNARLHADLYIAPPLEEEGFAAFDRVAQLADIGYRTAVDTLEGGVATEAFFDLPLTARPVPRKTTSHP